MTGYTVHTGSTKKFSEGWDRIFTGKKSASAGKAKKQAAARKSSKRSRKS